MAQSDRPGHASLFTVELRLSGIPRDAWELLAARARQLHADTVAIHLPGAFAHSGAADPQHGVPGLVQLCERLGLSVVLGLGESGSAALNGGPHERQVQAGDAPAGAWDATLAQALLPLQAPAGPIVALATAQPDLPAVSGRRRAAGWDVPIVPAALGEAAAPIARRLVLGVSDPPWRGRTEAHAPMVLIRQGGSARPGFWRAKMAWMLLSAARDDFLQARDAAGLAFDDMDARAAWADGEGIDIDVRYGPAYTYLFVTNRRAAPYSGLLAYRAPDGAVLHLHIGMGPGRAAVVLLSGDEVAGAAIDGEGSEGGWLARGLHTSAIFANGAGGVAPCRTGVLLTAPQSGRFQLRRGEGWEGMAGHRLLLDGALFPAPLQIDATHLSVPYIAEDERGQTDMYLVLPIGEPLPPDLRGYLAALLAGHAAALRRASALAQAGGYEQAADLFGSPAETLTAAARPATLDDYAALQREAVTAIRPAFEALGRALDEARGAYFAGTLAPEEFERREDRLGQILEVAAHGGEQ
jgi:hypothetical protein